MKSIKMLAIAVVAIVVMSVVKASAVSVDSTNHEYAVFSAKHVWIQEVVADATGVLNFTIHTINWDGVPQPEEITGSVYLNGELLASESMWYTDQGEQDILFTWNNLVELNEGEKYEFHLTGSDDFDNHAIKITSFNAYKEGDFWTPLHPKEAFSGSADLVFDNHIIPFEEALPSVECQEVVETIEVEVIKEVPVEVVVIKEVEVIKEVPVEVEVIKEVPVEVIVIKEVEVIKEVIVYVDRPEEEKGYMICDRHGYRNANHPNHAKKEKKQKKGRS